MMQEQKDQKQIVRDRLTDAIGNVNEEMLSEVAELRNKVISKPTGAWRKWALPLAACVVLMIGGLTTYAVLSSGGTLETEKEKPTDRTNSAYTFSVSGDIRIPMSEIKGDVVKLTEEMKERFKKHDAIYSSTYAGWRQLPFATVEDAKAYIGYDKINFPQLSAVPDQVYVEAMGNPAGKMEAMDGAAMEGTLPGGEHYVVAGEGESDLEVKLVSIRLEAEYQTDKTKSTLSYTSTASLSTEYDTADSGIRGIAWDGVDFTSRMQTENGREFYVLNATGFESGWLSQQVFWQENNVIYQLFLHYKEQDQKQADKVMLEWMNAF